MQSRRDRICESKGQHKTRGKIFDTYDLTAMAALTRSLTTARSRSLTRRGRGGEDRRQRRSEGRVCGGRAMECTTGFRRNDARSCAGENVRKEGKKREGWLADREHLLMEDEGREEIHE